MTGSAASALPATDVQVGFSAGRVSVSADDAPVAELLAAWARVGHVELSGTEYLGSRRLTLHLTNSAESDALRAIIGSPGWYRTVARDTPAATESAFQRIVILPAALTAARSSPEPERLYTYSMDPETDARALAMLTAPPRDPDAKTRPPDVEPEKFYQYADPVPPDAPDVLGILPLPGETSRQPLHLDLGVIPEVLYTYAPTTQPLEPVVISTSTVMPEEPALIPEARYTYGPTGAPDMPEYMLPPTASGIPNLPVFEGWTGLKIPGRTIRYVIGG